LASVALSIVVLLVFLLTASTSKAETLRTVSDNICPSPPNNPAYDPDGFGILSVAFSADGKFILAGGAGETAFLWDAQTGVLLHCFVGHRFAVERVAFAADGKTVLTSAWDGTSRLWDANTGAQLQILPNDEVTESPLVPCTHQMVRLYSLILATLRG
jgi:WD40 repeat protein